MAFAHVGSIGTVNHNSAANTLALVTTAAVEVGNVAVVIYAGDNLGSGTDNTDANEVTSVTDTRGNTWVKLKETSNNNGGAGNGTTVSVWYTTVATQIQIGDTITFNLSGSVTAKAASGREFTKGAGTTLAVEQTASEVGDTLDPAAISLSGMTSREYLLLWGFAGEQTNAGTFTADADYTDFTRDAAGTGSAAIVVWGGFRIATLTGDTVDAATGTDRDYAQVLGALYEVTPAAGQPTQMRGTTIPGMRQWQPGRR